MNKDSERKIFYFIIITGIILRIFKLGSQSVWIDEYITADLSNGKNLIYVFFNSLANNPHPPLFFLLEHFIIKIFGISEISIRFLPCIFGILNIFLIYKITRSFFTENVSIIATSLFALNPYQIYYSQEARMYSLFLFVSLLMVYYFIRSIQYNTFLYKEFIFWSVIGVYVHNYTVLLLLILNFLIFFKYKNEIRINLWIKSQIIIFIFWLPLSLFFIKGILGEGYSHKVNMLIAPIFSLKNYLFGLTIDFNLFIKIFLFFSFIIILIGSLTSRRIKEKKIIDIIIYISLLFVFIPWIESLIKKPVYSDRTLILINALLIILLSLGLQYLNKKVFIIYIVLILFIYGISLKNYYYNEKYQKINYKKQFLKISKEYKNKDIIIHTCNTSFASYKFYNNLMYKKNYKNKFLSEIPEFKGSSLKFKIRDLWRKFKVVLKEKLNIDIYAGYDKDIMPETELKKIIHNYNRIWFVMDNKIAIKQIWLPFGNIWNSKIIFFEPPDINNYKWILKYFKIKEKIKYYGTDIFLLTVK